MLAFLCRTLDPCALLAGSSHARSPYLCHKGLFEKRMVQEDILSCVI